MCIIYLHNHLPFILSPCPFSTSLSLYLSLPLPLGKPVMIITEYMENGSLDAFLRVSHAFTFHTRVTISYSVCVCACVCLCVARQSRLISALLSFKCSVWGTIEYRHELVQLLLRDLKSGYVSLTPLDVYFTY